MTALRSLESKVLVSRSIALSIVIVVIIVISSVLVVSIGRRSQETTNRISLEALTVSTSGSNITANINVARNTSNLVRMALFVNGTFMGSYNFTSTGFCLRMTHSWTNGTHSYYFTATPNSMPLMSNSANGYGCCLTDRTYMITIMTTFASGNEINSSSYVHVNGQGMGSMMR